MEYTLVNDIERLRSQSVLGIKTFYCDNPSCRDVSFLVPMLAQYIESTYLEVNPSFNPNQSSRYYMCVTAAPKQYQSICSLILFTRNEMTCDCMSILLTHCVCELCDRWTEVTEWLKFENIIRGA